VTSLVEDLVVLNRLEELKARVPSK